MTLEVFLEISTIAPAFRRSFLMPLVPQPLDKMFGCSLCFGYWIGLGATALALSKQSSFSEVAHAFVLAFGVALLSYVFDRSIYMLELTINTKEKEALRGQ